MGLSIAKSYVDLMGGTISVTSTSAQGSEFIVTLAVEKVARDFQTQQGPAEAACDFCRKGRCCARITT